MGTVVRPRDGHTAHTLLLSLWGVLDLHNNLDAVVVEREKLLDWEFPEPHSDDMKQDCDLCYLLNVSIELLAPKAVVLWSSMMLLREGT